MEDVNNNAKHKHTTSPSETVKVIVRCRPLSEKEMSSGHVSIVKVHRSTGEIEVDRPFSSVCNVHTSERKSFLFDSVFDTRVSQKELYDEAFRPLVDSVLEGFNGTVFAYGQTGTGKTYTMEGIRDSEEFQGVIPQAFKHIFSHISDSPEKRYLVRASYLEIYQEEVKDLLSNSRSKKCALREQFKNGVSIKGLSSYFCSSISEINDVMTKGNKNRSVGATNMNEHSSRSHAIFTITIEVCETWKDGQEHIKMGKLNLVDLAGSERQGKAGTSGERLREATKINLSLSALGNVISSLVDGSSHIPYRDSKLTRLLQDSLGGNSRTVMVATIGPANYNCDETLNTLRYACRAKRITNKPRINEDPKDAILREYQEEINRLKHLLTIKQQNQSQSQCHILDKIPDTSLTKVISDPKIRPEELRNPEKDLFLEKIRIAEQKRLDDLVPLLQPYGLDPKDDPQQIMIELEKRRDALIKDDGMVKEEKTRILKELDETTKHIKTTEEECSRLIERISWLESKLLNSGKTLLEHTEEQEQLLHQQRTALKEQEEKEKLLREQLRAKELSTLELENNLKECKAKVERKKAKLKKLKMCIKKAENRQFDIINEHETHVIETEKMLRNITLEYKMKKKMVDNFVPPKERKRLESRIRYDTESDNYFMLKEELKPIKRPPFTRKDEFRVYTQAGAKLSPMKEIYYSNENILQLAMEIPEWQKKKFVPEEVDPRLTSMVNSALEDAKETLRFDCRKLKKTPPRKQKKTHLFYAIGQEALLRQINLPKTQTNPNPLVHYEDFAVAENCIGENSSTECRVRILDESSSKLRGRRPTLGDIYAMPLFASPNSSMTQDMLAPEDESFDEPDLEEEGIDDLMEDLKNIELLNKMKVSNTSKELVGPGKGETQGQGQGHRKSKHTLSLDAFPTQHPKSRPKTRGKHLAAPPPKISASTGSIPKNVNVTEYDSPDDQSPQLAISRRESRIWSGNAPCIADDSGVLPEGCSGSNTWYQQPNPTQTQHDIVHREHQSHRLRPSSATIAFELDEAKCLENPALCSGNTVQSAKTQPSIKSPVFNPTEIKIIAKRSVLSCADSTGKLYSKKVCQKVSDDKRSRPRHLNSKRKEGERPPPMSIEVYDSVKCKRIGAKNEESDESTRSDNSSGYSCGGGSDIDDYMKSLCNNNGTLKYYK